MSRALLYTGVTLALGLMGLLAAAQIDLVPFKAGELILADEVNQNFQTLAQAIEAGALPQDCKAGEVPEWNGTGWSCGQDDVGAGGGGGDITAVVAGEGLSGGGESGAVTLAVGFDGSGAATSAARSDHDHMGQSWVGENPLILEAPAQFSTTTGGVLVVKNTNNDGAGVLVSESGGYGVWVRSAADIGLVIDSAGRHGIFAFGADAGAELHGQTAGLVVGGSPTTEAGVVPDIVLSGNSCFPCGAEDDDGFIRSDPSLGSSDILLVSNDDVVVQLDSNGGEGGVFQLQNEVGTTVFQVSENGDVHVNGNIVHSSDRAVKTSLGGVDAREVLDGLASLEISRWSFLADETGTPHVGPMAQDFNAAFGLGADERYISATDADGVTMAAIKGLYELVLEQQARIEALEAEVAADRGQ